MFFQIRPHLFGRPGLVCHASRQKVDQLCKVVVSKRPICIAPLAELFIAGAVRLAAHHGVVQRHSAALADQLSGRSQQGIDRNIEEHRELFQSVDAGDRLPCLPARHSLPCHKHLFSQFLLRQAFFRPERMDHIFGLHSNHLTAIVPQPRPDAKQPAVAPSPAPPFAGPTAKSPFPPWGQKGAKVL